MHSENPETVYLLGMPCNVLTYILNGDDLLKPDTVKIYEPWYVEIGKVNLPLKKGVAYSRIYQSTSV